MISITYFTTNYINYLYHYCNIPVTTINDYEIYCFNNSLTSGLFEHDVKAEESRFFVRWML